MTFLLKIFVCNKIKVFLFSTSRLVKLVNVYIHYPSICLTPSFLDAFKGKQTNFWFWVDSFHLSHTLWEYIFLLFKLLTLWVPALGESFFRLIFMVPPEESTSLTKIQTQLWNTFTVMQFCISDKKKLSTCILEISAPLSKMSGQNFGGWISPPSPGLIGLNFLERSQINTYHN